MAKNQVRMPTSTAGITNFYGDEDTKIKINPLHVVVLVIAVIVLMVLLHWLGQPMLN
ncbi:MAG: preprotein translocase subunit Sec61beta [Nanoarchaeota archaeon]